MTPKSSTKERRLEETTTHSTIIYIEMKRQFFLVILIVLPCKTHNMYTVHVTESQVIYVLYVIEDHRIRNLENGRKWIWHFRKQKTWDFTLIYILTFFY